MKTSSPAEHKDTVPTGSGGVGFTPGPWKVLADKIDVGPDSGFSVIGGCGCCDSPWVMPFEPKGEALANARLIAAAPELYEALRDFFENPDFVCTVGGNPIRVQAMMARGIAALKKARGES